MKQNAYKKLIILFIIIMYINYKKEHLKSNYIIIYYQIKYKF